MSQINERLLNEIEKIALVDTHEHTMLESERDEYAIDFTYLFAHYNSSDLVSAGMPPSLLEAVRPSIHRYRTSYLKRIKLRRFVPEPERENMSLEERWQALEPFWEATRNTAYAKATLIAVQDLFGLDDLNRDSYEQLSRAVADSRQPGWYRLVLNEKARIATSILDVNSTDVDRTLFEPVVRLDHFVDVRSRLELARLEDETGSSIHTIDALVEAMHKLLQQHIANGAVGIKTGLAYVRTLQVDNPSRHDADIAFSRMTEHPGEGPSFSEAKPLQDYMMHQVIKAAVDAELPIQIHTGLQEGNQNIITNAKPTHLINLFVDYPEAKFDLFHGGYPYIHEWATLAKTFANVYADLSWVHIISPEIGRRLLHELIETVPGNKIMAFGGDSITVEIAYAHAKMARRVVTRVFSEKVGEGYMTEEEAIILAQRVLRDNPAALFKLRLSS
jgi:hypothetical protein